MKRRNNNHTALDIAKQGGNSEIIHIVHIATKSSLAKQQDNDLLLAARLGYFDKVENLIKDKADLHACNANGVTVLHMAVTSGKLKIVKYLIEEGAIIDALDLAKTTPLHMACLYGWLEIVEYLIEKGAKLDALDINNVTPIHYATMHDGPKFWSVIKILIKNGADLNFTSKMEFTFLYKICYRGQDEIVNIALKYIDNINEIDKESYATALHAAAINGHTKVIHLLLNAGIDITIKNIDGHTAYYLAKNNSFYSIGKILSSDETKLISAAANGKIELIKSLLKKGGNIDAVNYYGNNALNLAVKRGDKNIAKFLLEQGSEIKTDILGENALYLAAKNNNCQIMELLIEHGANHTGLNWLGKSALDYTTECKYLEILPVGEIYQHIEI